MRPARTVRQVADGGQPHGWFRIGFGLGLGALAAYLLVQTVSRLGEVMVLVLLALFIAISLEPVIGWLTRRGLRRPWAVAVLVLVLLGCVAGFVALAVPPLADEIRTLVRDVPGWLQNLHDHQSFLGRLEDRYHLIDRAKKLASGGNSSALVSGLLGAGRLLISTITGLVLVCILTIYFLAGLPAIAAFCYRLVPRSRRARVTGLTEEVMTRTGRYMLANIVTSGIAGVATFLWLLAWGVPYPSLLGVFVALMDLVPVVGSTIGGTVVSLVALSVSFPVALATAGFYVGFRIAEDYLIMPKAMKYAVAVHPLVTILAVLAGGVLLGIVGALVAVPAAAALGLVLDDVVFPRLDRR